MNEHVQGLSGIGWLIKNDETAINLFPDDHMIEVYKDIDSGCSFVGYMINDIPEFDIAVKYMEKYSIPEFPNRRPKFHSIVHSFI